MSLPAQHTFDFVISEINQLIEEDSLEAIIEKYDNVRLKASYQNWSCLQQGRILHKLGVVHYLLDQEYKAIELFKQVTESVWHDCPLVEITEKENSHFNIGLCYQYTPEKLTARRYFVEAIQALETHPNTDDFDLAEKYHSAGVYFEEIRDITQSNYFLNNALHLYEKLPGTLSQQFEVLNSLIILALDFRQFGLATQYYDKAMVLLKDRSGRWPKRDQAIIHLNAASAYIELGEMDRGEQLVMSAQNLLDPLQDVDLYSNALETLAIIHKRRGYLNDALQSIEQVIDIRTDRTTYRHHYTSLAIAYENKAEILQLLGQIRPALRAINWAIKILCPAMALDEYENPIINDNYVSDPMQLSRLITIKARILQYITDHSSLDDPLSAAINTFAKLDTVIGHSIDHFDSDLSQLEFTNLIASYFGEAVTFYLKLSNNGQDKDYLSRAFQFADRSKALVLEKHLAGAHVRDALLPSELLNKEFSLRQAISQSQDLYLHAPSDSLNRVIRHQQVDLQVFYDSLDNSFLGPQGLQIQQMSVPAIAQIQDKLDPDQCMLAFQECNDKLIGFWITQDHFFFNEVLLDTSLLLNLSNVQMSQENPNLSYDSDDAREVYHKVFGPGLEQLPSISRLMIIRSPIFYSISIDALITSDSGAANDYLVSKFAISHAFSAALAMQKGRTDRLKRIIGFGTNYSDQFTQNFGSIEYLTNASLSNFLQAENEIESVCDANSGIAFLGKGASLDNFLRVSSTADLLYLSLHGLVDYNDPRRSCILFDDRRDPFILSPQLLQSVDLSTRLVILSSCHTASGKAFQGEGVSGMTRAFLYAGAQHVIASLWEASEGTATQLLPNMITNLQNTRTLDRAVQLTKQKYLETASPRMQHPFYWSNFIIVGSLDQTLSGGTSPKFVFLFAASILVFWILFRFTKKTFS